jgi:hypothetical protein
MTNKILTGTVFEDQPVYLRRRVMAKDGTGSAVAGEEGKALRQADINSIALAVYNLSGGTPGTPVHEAVLDKTLVVFDTLQTGWTVDSAGYNFAHTLPTSVLTGLGAKRVRVKVTFTLTGGTPVQIVWDLTVLQVTP